MTTVDYAKIVENAAKYLQDAGFESIVIITTAPDGKPDRTGLFATSLGNTFANDRAVQFWIEKYGLDSQVDGEDEEQLT